MKSKRLQAKWCAALGCLIWTILRPNAHLAHTTPPVTPWSIRKHHLFCIRGIKQVKILIKEDSVFWFPFNVKLLERRQCISGWFLISGFSKVLLKMRDCCKINDLMQSMRLSEVVTVVEYVFKIVCLVSWREMKIMEISYLIKLN